MNIDPSLSATSSTPEGLGTVSKNMEALATRIQDRANQFISEQAKLTSLQQDLREISILEAKEALQNQNLRRKVLETTRGRHGMELEILNAEKKCREVAAEIQNLEKESLALEGKTQTAKEEFQEDIESLYAPHHARIELYEQVLNWRRQEILDRKSRKRQRQEQVKARVLQLKKEITIFDQKSQYASSQTEDLKQEELQGDARITSLASQVKRALSEVRKKGNFFTFYKHHEFLPFTFRFLIRSLFCL
jgi:chromosome segregation ATPase